MSDLKWSVSFRNQLIDVILEKDEVKYTYSGIPGSKENTKKIFFGLSERSMQR